jgi:Mrp family chromosome partitioning ATPase
MTNRSQPQDRARELVTEALTMLRQSDRPITGKVVDVLERAEADLASAEAVVRDA